MSAAPTTVCSVILVAAIAVVLFQNFGRYLYGYKVGASGIHLVISRRTPVEARGVFRRLGDNGDRLRERAAAKER